MGPLIGEYQLRLLGGCEGWSALATLGGDISAVFPYLNAGIASGFYDHQTQLLILRGPRRFYVFHPDEIRISHVSSLAEAQRLMAAMVGKVNRASSGRSTGRGSAASRAVALADRMAK